MSNFQLDWWALHSVSQVTFPGLICRTKQPKIVLLIFVSGKIVFTRAKIVLIPGGTPYSVRSPVMGSSSVAWRLMVLLAMAVDSARQKMACTGSRRLDKSKEQLRRPRPARRSSGHSSGEQQGGAPASSRE